MMRTDDVGEIDARGVASRGGRAPVAESYDLAVVCQGRALACLGNGARCESTACSDVGRAAADAQLDAERAA